MTQSAEIEQLLRLQEPWKTAANAFTYQLRSITDAWCNGDLAASESLFRHILNGGEVSDDLVFVVETLRPIFIAMENMRDHIEKALRMAGAPKEAAALVQLMIPPGYIDAATASTRLGIEARHLSGRNEILLKIHSVKIPSGRKGQFRRFYNPDDVENVRRVRLAKKMKLATDQAVRQNIINNPNWINSREAARLLGVKKPYFHGRIAPQLENTPYRDSKTQQHYYRLADIETFMRHLEQRRAERIARHEALVAKLEQQHERGILRRVLAEQRREAHARRKAELEKNYIPVKDALELCGLTQRQFERAMRGISSTPVPRSYIIDRKRYCLRAEIDAFLADPINNRMIIPENETIRQRIAKRRAERSAWKEAARSKRRLAKWASDAPDGLTREGP